MVENYLKPPDPRSSDLKEDLGKRAVLSLVQGEPCMTVPRCPQPPQPDNGASDYDHPKWAGKEAVNSFIHVPHS